MLNKLRGHSRSVSWFTVIGALAALVHYVVAVSLESMTTLTPAWANLAGFLLAFPVSYVGHTRFSFASHRTRHQQALPRFFAVAMAGFFGNQLLVLSALHFTPLPFWLALGIVMVIIAVSTYLLSRYWAFKAA